MDKESIGIVAMFLVASAIFLLVPQVYTIITSDGTALNSFTVTELFGSALLYITLGLWMYFSYEHSNTELSKP
jgi:hypothetical protein